MRIVKEIQEYFLCYNPEYKCLTKSPMKKKKEKIFLSKDTVFVGRGNNVNKSRKSFLLNLVSKIKRYI